jgi:hypothetical protein
VRDVLDEIGLSVGKVLDLKIRRGDRNLEVSLTTAPEAARR